MIPILIACGLSGGTVPLPEQGRGVRGGLFGWANLLDAQRMLVSDQELTLSGYKIKFKNGELNLKPVLTHLLNETLGTETLQSILNDTFQSLSGKARLLGTSFTTGITSCSQLEEGFGRTVCNFVGEKYMQDLNVDLFAAQVASLAAVLLVISFFALLSLILYVTNFIGCFLCCKPRDHKRAGLATLIPFLIGVALVSAGAIFFLVGWFGLGPSYDVFSSFSGEDGPSDGYLSQMIDSINNSVAALFDDKKGMPIKMTPFFTSLDATVDGFVAEFAKVFQSTEEIRQSILASFDEVFQSFQDLETPSAQLNSALAACGVPSNESFPYSQMATSVNSARDLVDGLAGEVDELHGFEDLANDVQKQVYDALSPLRKALLNPSRELKLGGKTMDTLLADLKRDYASTDSEFGKQFADFSKPIKDNWTWIQLGYFVLPGLCLLMCLACGIAFCGHSSASRVIASGAAIVPFISNLTCLAFGIAGSFA
jgi:hypothetical protein